MTATTEGMHTKTGFHSVRNQLFALVLLAVLLPVLLTQGLGVTTTQSALKRDIDENFYQLSINEAETLSDALTSQVSLLKTLAVGNGLRLDVQSQNSFYTGDDETNLARIAGYDAEWIAAYETGNSGLPLIQLRLNDPFSVTLTDFRDQFSAHLELFVTDRYGAIVATTNVTSDYYQGDEEWWQAAWNSGQGAVFIDKKITYDASANIYSIIMAIPIPDASGVPIGVLRTTYNVTALRAGVILFSLGDTGRADLVGSDAALLASKNDFDFDNPPVVEEYLPYLGQPYDHTDGDLITAHDSVGRKGIIAPALVTTGGAIPAIDNLGWHIVIFQNEDEALGPISDALRTALLATVLVLAAALFVTFWFSRRLIHPLQMLTQDAQTLSTANDWGLRTRVVGRNEFGVLGRAFNEMASQVQTLVGSLEQRVQARTQDLFLTLEVGQLATRISQQSDLLPRVVEFIQQRFDLYYTQVYLVDDARRYAVLAAGTTDVGRQLLQRKHRLGLNEASIVARAIQTRRPVLVEDTRASDFFKPNPLLPDTRSEVAIPLIVGDDIIGVIDLQSRQVANFTADSLPVFEAMASSVASSLRSAQAFEATRTAIERADAINRRLTAQTWEPYLGRLSGGERVGYEYDLQTVKPLTESVSGDGHSSDEGGSARLAHPITLRRQEIGTILVGEDTRREWTAEETSLIESVADRVAQAVEQFRAFDETDKRARDLQAVTEVSAVASATLDPDQLLWDVMGLTKERFGLYHAHVYLLDETGENLDLAAGAGDAGKTMVSQGRRIPVSHGHSLVARAARTRAGVVVNDVTEAPDFLPNPLLPDTRSEMAIPMISGNQLIGVLDVQADAVGHFTEDDVRIQSTLAAQLAISIQNARSFATGAQRLAIIENTDQIVVMVDLQGQIVYINPAGARLVGLEKPEDIVGKSMASFTPPDAMQRADADLMPTILQQGFWRGEATIAKLDGTLIPTEQTSFVIRDESGEPQFLATIMTDITERKEAEQQIREQQALLRSIIDTSPDWIFAKDEDYRYLLVNKSFAEFYGGIAPDEMVGKDDYDLGTPAEFIEGDPEKGIVGFRTDDRAVVERHETLHNPNDVVQHTDGTIHVYDTNKLPLRDANGNVIGVLGVSRDVTEARQQQELIERRAVEMAAVAEVGAQTSTILNVNELLWAVTNLTKERFGLYHAHVYLLAESGENLTLAAGAGDAGRTMVSQGRSIALDNERSIVARAARTRRAAIENDVAQAPDFMPNPLLPDTHAELAVPLIVGDTLLGVLDVQSEVVGRFTRDDEQVMGTLAAQVAVAVQNARLFAESAQRLAIIETTNQLVALTDLQGNGLYINPAGARLLGLEKPEDIRSRSMTEFAAPGGAQRALEEKVPAAMQQDYWQGESALQLGDGTIIPIDQTTFIIRDAQGQPQYVATITSDIRERKAAQEEIDRQRRTLEAMLENLPVGVFMADAKTGMPLLANRAAIEMLGKGIDPTAAKDTLAEVYAAYLFGTDEPYPAAEMPLVRGMSGERAHIDNMEVRQSDGRRALLEVFGAPVPDAAGNIVAGLAVFQDITERHQAEEAIRRYANEMEAVAAVGSEATTTLDWQELLQNVADMTKERFGLYHAHLYLLDDAENLTLAAGAGAIGRRMMALGHRIPLKAERSLVARAARSGEAVIENNVRQATDFLPNPNLPRTRSEMALPMIAGDRVIGVLDVQADLANRFTSEDVSVMTILASQVAAAAENARLFANVQEASSNLQARIKEVRALQEIGAYGEEGLALEEYLTRVANRIPASLQYPDLCVAAIDFGGEVYGDRRALDVPSRLTNPITLGRQEMGTLVVGYTEARDFLPEEIPHLRAVCNRIGTYLENRQLFEQTQEALEQTATLYNSSQALIMSDEPETLLRAIAGKVLETSEGSATLFLHHGQDAQQGGFEYMQAVACIQTTDRIPPTPIGMRSTLKESPMQSLIGDDRREIIVIPDLTADATLDEVIVGYFSALNIQAMAILPLVTSGGSQVGTLALTWPEPHTLNPQEVQLLSVLAPQMATVLDNQRLFEQTQHALAETEQLYQASRRITAANSAEDLLSAVLESVPVAAINRAMLLSFEHNAAGDLIAWNVAANWHDGRGTPPQAVGSRLEVGVAFGSGIPSTGTQPVFMEDLLGENVVSMLDSFTLERAKEFNTHAVGSLPMWVGGRQIGMLVLEGEQPHRFTDEETRSLTVLAGQMAVALDSLNLLEQTRRRASEMQAVAEVGAEASSSLDLNNLLLNVVNLTKERFQLYHAHIYLLSKDGKDLVETAGAGAIGERMVAAGHRIAVDAERSVVARAARARRSQIVNNVKLEPDFLPNPMLPLTRSEMAVPMIAGDELLGVLDVQSDQVNRFTDEDVRVQTTLSYQVAVAIQNAQLYAEQVLVADQLREVDRLKSEFLASMSHELRTPLNSIIGYAEVLLDGIDGDLTEDMEEDVSAIHGSGKHLLNLINDVLDLAKIEAGQMDLVTENFIFAEVAEDMTNTARVLVKDKPVDLVVAVDPDLPKVHGDVLRIRQVINNILSNAIKFTEKGSVTLGARRYNRDPNQILIYVADTGIGLKPEQVTVIFDRFRQVDQSHTRRAGGTGLGLSITKQLVEMHGGQIWVESEFGSGSTFYFTLPAAKADSTEE